MAPYFIRNLIPRKEKRDRQQPLLQTLRQLSWVQWAMVFSGWLSWTCDSMDFFSVSLSVSTLSKPPPLGFGHDTTAITSSITLTLLLRSVGAATFGIISDRYGRKWPLVIDLLLCCTLQIGTSFCTTFKQFLALRSLFGIVMGGTWGLAVATALENIPVEARGFLSGILQEGYAVGYLIAAVVNLTLVPHNVHSWRTLFWVSAGLSFFAAMLRAILPESELFLRARAEKRVTTISKTKIFLRETKAMIMTHWAVSIYTSLLMAGMSLLAHGSQDLYPTYITDNKRLSSLLASKATIIGNCGAIAGGAIAGWASQYIGRRLVIMICFCIGLAFIPLWILPSSFSGLAAGAFFIQVGIQGAFGVIPIFLNEISPPAFRGFFPGVVYQIGNMVAAASAQIEARGGENYRTTVGGKDVPNYAKVQSILVGVVSAFVILIILFGPENHGLHFEKHKMAYEEGGGQDNAYVEEDLSPVISASTEKSEKVENNNV